MLTHTFLTQPDSGDNQDSTDTQSAPRFKDENYQSLYENEKTKQNLRSIEQETEKLGEIFQILSTIGQSYQNLQDICREELKGKYEAEDKDSVKTEQSLPNKLLQTHFPNSQIIKLAKIGYEVNVWLSSARKATAAKSVQTKLDKFEVGQRLGEYKVGQRNTSKESDEPIFIKVLEWVGDGTVFSVDPGEIELGSLEENQLIELDQLLSKEISQPIPSATDEIWELNKKLESPQHWLLTMLGWVEKFTGNLVKHCPVINNRGALTLQKWPSIAKKINPLQDEKKLKGEFLELQVQRFKHSFLLEERLNLTEIQVLAVHERVWELAAEKEQESRDSQEGVGRPVGKVGSQYAPIPWTSDILEVLEAIDLEANLLAALRYDLRVFLEEYDWQLAAAKYKLNKDAIGSLKRTVEELKIENNRPVDPITGLVRAYKDDLYQAIAQSDRDASKLLKKEVVRYSLDDVEEIIEVKTEELKEENQELKEKNEELEQKLSVTEERLNSMEEQMNKMQMMLNQLMAQQQSVNGNGHHPVAVSGS